MMNAKIKKFVTDLFCEADGNWSLSRFTSAGMVSATIGWISFIVFKLHQPLPDLTAPAIFAGGAATHYGIGKWFAKKADPPNTSA
jgi:hypothetical protein